MNKSIYQMPTTKVQYSDASMVNKILEREQITNKTEIWSKLNRNVKLEKINEYIATMELSEKQAKNLRLFLYSCIERDKLTKTKDVIYDKEQKKIMGIPGLAFDVNNHTYTIKNIDAKRVSTLKCLP